MSENLTIPKEVSNEYGSAYSFLREAGLNYIQQLSGKLWTDYNAHDPGITMLELLCYAITDLGYRISMPVEDILASPKNNFEQMHKHFLSALNIMPCAPVTANDYRKLLVRIDGVKNAWLLKAEQTIIANYMKLPARMHYAHPNETLQKKEIKIDLKGLYNILIEYEEIDETTELEIAKRKFEIINKVKTVFHHFRNLCENVIEIKEVPEQKFILCAEIELYPKADPEQVWANIISDVELYLSPSINFYSLQEMLDKKKTTEEIFEGPVFNFDELRLTKDETYDKKIFSKKGFIDNDEIAKSGLRTEIRLSDLINIISKIDGVKIINSIAIKPCADCNCNSTTSPAQKTDQWILNVKKGYKPTLNAEKSVVNFYKDVIPIELKTDEANLKLDALKSLSRLARQSDIIEDLPIPTGTYRSISNYNTVQNHFPDNYGINQTGLSGNASTKRKALAQQLKAYLLFFDQVLANYFAQLENARTLLGTDSNLKKTYFGNAVKNLKEVEKIFSPTANWESAIEELIQNANLDNYVERKNKFLDHLLARFSEQFNEYVFILHRIYNEDFDQAIIRHKTNFHSDYQQISAFRGSGFDFFNKKTEANELINVSGLEKRISRMLGFNNYKKTKISSQPYKIEKVDPSSASSKYTWTISQGASAILKGTGNMANEAEAMEEMGLASILGCERENYNIFTSGAGNLTQFTITNSSKKVIAYAAKKYQTKSKAETDIQKLIQFFLDDFKLEGIYVIEHILLRPGYKHSISSTFMPVCVDSNGKYCKPLDPYSFRITVVLPGYTMRLRNIDFRKYVEQLIRTETPAHILPKICFIGEEQMGKFESYYQKWLSGRINSTNPEKQVDSKFLKKFINLIENLYTVYPEGQLADCNDDTEEKNPVILGRTYLGTLDIKADDQPS